MSEPIRVAFISLGCAKNLVDSEHMLGQLAGAGCDLTNDPDDADAIIINTCGFLEAARLEAHEAIAEAVSYKQSGRCQKVIVAGCLAQRDGTRLLQDVAGIDAMVGVNNRADIVKAVQGIQRSPAGAATAPVSLPVTQPRAPELFLGDYYWHQDDDRARLRLTPSHYAYLRISEGCSQKCTFCTIPSIRGTMHCKSVDQILAEARELISDGAVELNLIGQDTTSYGQDIAYSAGLGGLLRALNGLHGARWIRLLYAYPSNFSRDMLAAIAECDKVVPYVDLPLQHINDRVLKAMHRRVTRRQTESLLQDIRTMIPDVTLRTTMIVGFPGETDAEFQELLDFVTAWRFDALGVFCYSQEPETPAGIMKGQLPEAVKQQRADVLMAAQQEVAFDAARAKVGRQFTIVIDGPAVDGAQPARHAGQAPQVDSRTWVTGGPHAVGAFCEVRCVDTREYDLIAQPTTVMLPVLP